MSCDDYVQSVNAHDQEHHGPEDLMYVGGTLQHHLQGCSFAAHAPDCSSHGLGRQSRCGEDSYHLLGTNDVDMLGDLRTLDVEKVIDCSLLSAYTLYDHM